MSSSQRYTAGERVVGSTSDSPYGRLLWWCLIGVATAAGGYGFWAGDVTSREALPLVEASDAAHGSADESSGYAKALGGLHAVAGMPVTAWSARFCSLVAVILTVVLIYRWVRDSVGVHAARAATLACACALPPICLSVQATVDAWFVLLIIAVGWCWFANREHGNNVGARSRHLNIRWWRLAASVMLAIAAVWLVRGEDLADWAGMPNDRYLAPFYSLLLASPWAVGTAALVRKETRNALTAGSKECLLSAAAMTALALVLSVSMPALWLAAAWLISVSVAMAVGVCWQLWMDDSLAEFSRRYLSASAACLAIGFPAIAVLLAVVRIGTHFHFMERVQAIVVVGLGALLLAFVLVQRQSRQLYWLPILAVAVICKVIFVQAYLPERDKWHSSKPWARALRQQLTDNAVLYTDHAIDPAFRYYLGVRVEPLDQLSSQVADSEVALSGDSGHAKSQSGNGTELAVLGKQPFMLVHQSHQSGVIASASGRWRMVRNFEWQAGNPLMLWRHEPTHAELAPRSMTEASRPHREHRTESVSHRDASGAVSR